MPPFISTNCTQCNKPNRFDLTELRIINGYAYRGEGEEETFMITCKDCGREFKFTLEEGKNGKSKTTHR